MQGDYLVQSQFYAQKNALASSPSEVKVIVDNNVAKENVTKLLESNGYSVNVNEQEEDIFVNGKK